jgi:hypothetical protein
VSPQDEDGEVVRRMAMRPLGAEDLHDVVARALEAADRVGADAALVGEPVRREELIQVE